MDQGGNGTEVARARASLVDGAERAVRGWLEPGRFREGDRLPTEEKLAEMLGISRGTLRTALRRLESSGEIVRRQGSGTFVGRVTAPFGSAPPRLRADYYRIQATGGKLTLTAMSIETGPVGAVAGSGLGVDPERPALGIHRCLSAGETPVAVTHDIFHPELELPPVAALRSELRGGRSVHEVIDTLTDITFSRRRTEIRSLLLGPDDALGRQLRLNGAAACLELVELTFSDGRPIFYSRDILAPGQVDIEVEQTADAPPPRPIVERVG